MTANPTAIAPELQAELRTAQAAGIAAIADWPPADWRRAFNPDLSPAGWHIGHMATIEAFWIREELLGEPLPAAWKTLYFPESIAKAARAEALPEKHEIKAFAQATHADNLAALARANPAHPLLANDYLLHFLLQHHAQHRETLAQIARQRALHRADTSQAHFVAAPVAAMAPKAPDLAFAAVEFHAGAAPGPLPYDNELPTHRVELRAFALGREAVSNGEYLGFMQAGGYDDARYWSAAGFSWRAGISAQAPQHWRRDATGNWYAVESGGAVNLAAEAPVDGLSYYEAEAFARYAGARLPHEHEWEYARRHSPRLACGRVWEWCANAFYPYPGFRAFPYAGYSTPWFDGRHFVLRGGSRHTAATIARPTFRNFFTADQRHLFAGLRLAQDK